MASAGCVSAPRPGSPLTRWPSSCPSRAWRPAGVSAPHSGNPMPIMTRRRSPLRAHHALYSSSSRTSSTRGAPSASAASSSTRYSAGASARVTCRNAGSIRGNRGRHSSAMRTASTPTIRSGQLPSTTATTPATNSATSNRPSASETAVRTARVRVVTGRSGRRPRSSSSSAALIANAAVRARSTARCRRRRFCGGGGQAARFHSQAGHHGGCRSDRASCALPQSGQRATTWAVVTMRDLGTCRRRPPARVRRPSPRPRAAPGTTRRGRPVRRPGAGRRPGSRRRPRRPSTPSRSCAGGPPR